MNTTHSPSDTPCASTNGGWFKSSYSGGTGTECVETARLAAVAVVRDSKHPHGPRLTFADCAWEVFLDALQADQLR